MSLFPKFQVESATLAKAAKAAKIAETDLASDQEATKPPAAKAAKAAKVESENSNFRDFRDFRNALVLEQKNPSDASSSQAPLPNRVAPPEPGSTQPFGQRELDAIKAGSGC